MWRWRARRSGSGAQRRRQMAGGCGIGPWEACRRRTATSEQREDKAEGGSTGNWLTGGSVVSVQAPGDGCTQADGAGVPVWGACLYGSRSGIACMER